MPAIPLNDASELTRDEVITRYRERITADKRVKLYKTELEQLIQDFLIRLEGLKDEQAIRELCHAEMALLEEGYKLSTVAFDYLPKYRKAVEEAIALERISVTAANSHRFLHTQRVTGMTEERFEHYALTYLKYDEATYEALDSRSQETNRHRQFNLKVVNPWVYLEKLKELLHSEQKFVARHQAIAIAGLTGRRIGEVIARGHFSLSKHPYLLRFEGHSKTQRDAYEIVTLISAAELLPYIEQFRDLDAIKLLLLLEGEELTSAINQFDVQVNRECKKYLGEIVPPLEGREGVSVHNLRSLWGAIAAYFFCPPTSHEYPFLQHYLGHVMESPATGHYFRYRLVDEQGQFLEDRGIYISECGELPLPGQSEGIKATDTIAETMTDEVDEQGDTDTPDDTLSVQPLQLSLLPAVASDQSLSEALLDALTRMFKSDRYTVLLTALMAITGRSPGELLKSGVFESLADEPFALSFSATGVGAKSRLVTLVSAKAVKDGVIRLRQHESLQELLYQPPSTIDSRCQLYVTTAVRKYLPFADLEEMLSAYSRFTQGSVAVLPQKVAHPPTVSGNLYAEDKQRLNAIASRLQIEGTQPQIFHALLDWVEAQLSDKESQSQENSSSTQEPLGSPFSDTFAQAINHQAQTLAWLTGRVESLEGQVNQLQTERDEARAIAQPSRHLREENQQLREQNQTLLETASRFESARQALLGEQMTLPLTSSEPSLSSQPATPKPVTAAPPVSPASSKGRRQRSDGGAIARARKIVKAISQWNQSHSDDAWAITRGLLEEGFGIHRQAANEFLSEYQPWIDEIHSHSGITKVRAHNRGKDVTQLKAWVEKQGQG